MYVYLADRGSVFSMRDRGRRLLADLRDEIERDDELVLDFEGVISLSHSFADEFVGELAEQAARGKLPHPEVINAAAPIHQAINRSFRARGIAGTGEHALPA